MLRVARGLAGRGLAVDVVAVRPEGELASGSGGAGDPRSVLLGTGSTSAALPRLVGYLRRTRPAILVSGQPHLNIASVTACRLARTGTRTAFIEHAPLRSEIRFYGGWRYRMLHVLVPPFYRMADRIVAVSAGVRRELETLLPGVEPELIPNPVLPDDLARRAAEPVAHPWLAGDGGPPVVVTVGRLAREKDFPTLVRAVALLNRQRPTRLLILGEGPDRARIESTAKAEGVADLVSLPGTTTNVFAHLSRASAFALTSQFEGFGNVLVEALACGLPVVSTDCPVGPREILENGRLGRLVPPGDAAALAVALGSALDTGRQPAAVAVERVARYSERNSVDQYLAALRRLAPECVESFERQVPQTVH